MPQLGQNILLNKQNCRQSPQARLTVPHDPNWQETRVAFKFNFNSAKHQHLFTTVHKIHVTKYLQQTA